MMIDENNNKDDVNDENEDFGDDDDLDFGMDDDVDFDDFDGNNGGSSTLGDLWRNNPMVKIGVILAVAALVFSIIIMFSGSSEQSQPSLVSGGSDIKSTPGEEGATRDFIEAVQESNETTAEEAMLTGGSALPVPIEAPVQVLQPKSSQQEQEDPLSRWRRLQEERVQQEIALEQQQQQFQPIPNAPADTSAAEAVQAMAEAMSQQMQAILENKTQAQISYRSVNTDAYLDALKAEEEQKAELAAQQQNEAQGNGPQTIIMPAGEILYSQLITEANSDTPGPVLAQIVAGPLKGSRIIGDFEVQKELLTLTFHTVVVDGQSLAIDAVAVDPNTTLPGMATEVDHRYLQRVILPAAAAFIEGTASAVANSGLTTITVEGDTVTESQEDADNEQEISAGVEELGREVGDILDDIANDTEILVRIASGTPMGILFLQPVIKENTVTKVKENQSAIQSTLDAIPQ